MTTKKATPAATKRLSLADLTILGLKSPEVLGVNTKTGETMKGIHLVRNEVYRKAVCQYLGANEAEWDTRAVAEALRQDNRLSVVMVKGGPMVFIADPNYKKNKASPTDTKTGLAATSFLAKIEGKAS